MCLFGLLLCFSFPMLWNMFIFSSTHCRLVAFPLKPFITNFKQLQPSVLHCSNKYNHHYFLKVIKSFFFFFPFSLSPFGRTLEMMALCISPRWPRPTWPTTPVMPMATRNFFRPTLFKWMVRNCRKDGIQNHVSLHSKSIWTWSGALDKAFHDGALVSTVTFTIIQFLL